jgi:hypothetical protein
LLATAADGHMRDFQMSLDQLAVGGALRTADVAAGLDLEWANVALRTLIALAKGDYGAAKTSLRDWSAPPQTRARALRDGLVHVAHTAYTDRREHPEGTAAFSLASRALVDELADALGACPGGFGVQPLAYILALAEQWSRCAPHLHDEGDLDMELLRATHALLPSDASLPPIPADPFVAAPPPRVRRRRGASTALPKTSKSRPEFLTKRDVAAEYRAATMLPQEHGIWFNARLKLRYADYGIVDVSASLKLQSDVTHELRLRQRDWSGDPAYQLHYLVQNEVDDASCLTSWLLLSVPPEHLVRTREWLTTKLPTRPGELMPVLGNDVWRAPSIARPASLHWSLMRELWRALDPEILELDGTRRVPLKELLSVPLQGPRVAGVLPPRVRRWSTSQSLSEKIWRTATVDKFSYLSAFDRRQWRAIDSGWEADEFEHRRAERRRREEEIAKIEAAFPPGRDSATDVAREQKVRSFFDQLPFDPIRRGRQRPPW